MSSERISKMLAAHEVLKEFEFEPVELDKGYTNRTMRINLDTNEISIHPVTQQMKDLWVGGKGFDLWLMFKVGQPGKSDLFLTGSSWRNNFVSRLWENIGYGYFSINPFYYGL